MNGSNRASGLQIKSQYADGPVATVPQVDAQLDSACFSMEALESTVATLLNRLIAVTFIHPDDEQMPEATSPLVPVAARISYLESRLRNVEARLSRALLNLQV